MSEAELPVKVLRKPNAARGDYASPSAYRGALAYSVRLDDGTLATSVGDFPADEKQDED